MSDFCKLFETEQGQILVLKDTNDECAPALKFIVSPPSLGLATTIYAYSDDDIGWGARDEAFDNTDLEMAEAVTADSFSFAANFVESGDE